MSENKTNNFNTTHARQGVVSFENTQRIAAPSEASNKNFLMFENLDFLMAVAT